LIDIREYGVVDAFKDLWLQIYSYQPRLVCIRTIKNVCLSLDSDAVKIDFNDILWSANALIKVCEPLRRNSSIFIIFLQILEFGSSSFRHQLLSFKVTIYSLQNLNKTQKDSSVLAHDSLVIQNLFSMLITKNDQIIQLICLFVHQIFINRVSSLKLVLFQGFDVQIIPIVVDKVPSIRKLD
jgi:hypothetical protein